MTTNESLTVEALARRILSEKRKSAHFEAVQALCTFALEIYKGVQQLVAVQNGVSAQALLRTLCETVIGVIILGKHPEKLDDFLDHGKLTAIRMARSIPKDSPLAKKQVIKPFQEFAKEKFDHLQFRFKNRSWHLLKIKEAFAEAEMPDNIHERYYARASAIAHGQPFVVVQHLDMEGKNWKIQPRCKEWDKWSSQARMMSMLLMLDMIGRVSCYFSLGLETELSSVRGEVHALASQEMKSAKDLPDAE